VSKRVSETQSEPGAPKSLHNRLVNIITPNTPAKSVPTGTYVPGIPFNDSNTIDAIPVPEIRMKHAPVTFVTRTRFRIFSSFTNNTTPNTNNAIHEITHKAHTRYAVNTVVPSCNKIASWTHLHPESSDEACTITTSPTHHRSVIIRPNGSAFPIEKLAGSNAVILMNTK